MLYNHLPFCRLALSKHLILRSSMMSQVPKSYFLAISGFSLFGCTALVVKDSNLSSIDLVFYRMAITAFATWLLLVSSGQSFVGLNRTSLPSALGASAALFLNMVCLFTAFKMAPVSLCVALFFAGPIFTILARRLVWKSPILKEDAISCTLSLLAIVLLVTQGTGTADNKLGYFFALLGGFLFGMIPIFEKGTRALQPHASLLIQSSFAALCLLPFSWSTIPLLTLSNGIDILVLGVLMTFIPLILWWASLRLNDHLSPFVSYADPITATLVSLFILKESLGIVQVMATLLLLSAAIYPVLAKRRRVFVPNPAQVATLKMGKK